MTQTKPIRSMIVNRYDGAAMLHISHHLFMELVREGYIKPAKRKGFYRVGSVIDGHAEAVRMKRIAAPHERANNPQLMFCPIAA